MKESQIIVLGIILISFVIGIYFYPQMPDEMALHWNLEGRAGNYVPKIWALSFEPLLSIGLFLLFLAIPKIDPLKENIRRFGKYYDGLVVFFVVFLFARACLAPLDREMRAQEWYNLQRLNIGRMELRSLFHLC